MWHRRCRWYGFSGGTRGLRCETTGLGVVIAKQGETIKHLQAQEEPIFRSLATRCRPPTEVKEVVEISPDNEEGLTEKVKPKKKTKEFRKRRKHQLSLRCLLREARMLVL